MIYEPALGERGPFTPQMVVNGADSLVGNNYAEVERVVASAKPIMGPAVALAGGAVRIGSGDTLAADADVWLVRYDPNVVEVPVGRGENTGWTLAHTNVVHSLQRLGTWSGTERSFDVAAAPDGLSTAILVQLPRGGHILAAVTD